MGRDHFMFKLPRYFSSTCAAAVVAVSAVLLRGCHRSAVNVRGWICEPFFSAESTGLGMALSISRSVVEARGGRLWVASAGRIGAEFRFGLPDATETAGQ